MPLVLSRKDWTDIFPKAPSAIIDAFVAQPHWFDQAGITATRTRLAYTLANVEHECAGFTIKNLTENINYTAKRMAEVWPNRFDDEDEVVARYGSAPGWQKKAFDEIYGNRMGNRPGTNDGSTYIGRGGPQITGRDGYRHVGQRCNLALEANPSLATLPDNQPAIIASFYSWKGLSHHADKGDFLGFVKAWNGGGVGLADRQAKMQGNDLVIQRLKSVVSLMPLLDNVA